MNSGARRFAGRPGRLLWLFLAGLFILFLFGSGGAPSLAAKAGGPTNGQPNGQTDSQPNGQTAGEVLRLENLICVQGDLHFSIDKNQLAFPALPSVWDGRLLLHTPEAKAQEGDTECWAYAAASTLEAGLGEDFSPEGMLLESGFDTSQGGTMLMAAAYLSRREAPERWLLEEAWLMGGDINSIKAGIVRFGAVQATLYLEEVPSVLVSPEAFGLSPECYDPSTAAYYYDGKTSTNHDVAVVGWDDAFPREAFAIEPPGDGAFICLNSWGRDFGEAGYFYVSYYDTAFAQGALGYAKLSEKGEGGRQYLQDPLGWLGQAGYSEPSAIGAAVFRAVSGEEALSKISFYTTKAHTAYEVRVYIAPADFPGERAEGAGEGIGSIRPEDASAFYLLSEKVGEGTLPFAGYHTLELASPMALEEGQLFVIFLSASFAEGTGNPLAVQMQDDIPQGISFISRDGSLFVDAGEILGATMCIRAFTDEK